MQPRRELLGFGAALGLLVALFLHDSLLLGRVLSPVDVLFAQRCFNPRAASFDPSNRLLIDRVLQFEPWLAFNRAELRQGRLPLWNPHVGGGAPHLANGQSAVFDPINFIAYVMPFDSSHAWCAGLRLWISGVGAFLLARAWGLGTAGRWFAGLVYPFTGFQVLWLLYPVTAAAIWLPWMFLATVKLLVRPGPGRIAGVGAATALSLLAGHVQTTAHILIAAAAYLAFRLACSTESRGRRASILAGWFAGVVVGCGIAAIQLVPLGSYLSRSPVWADRERERPGVLDVKQARILDVACTFVPYLYGSQRRGHPNVASALGVGNLNESASGYAGLPVWLALVPLGCLATWREPRTRFLAVLVASGFLLGYRVPPFTGILGLVPILNVIDHRRTLLWVAFGLTFLAALGLDSLVQRPPRPIVSRRLVRIALVVAAGSLVLAMASRPLVHWLGQSRLQAAVSKPPQSATDDPVDQRIRRHLDKAAAFYPFYFTCVGAVAGGLGVLLLLQRKGAINPRRLQIALTGLTLFDLFLFGLGVNPSVPGAMAHPRSPVIDRLLAVAPPPARILVLDPELPPNTLMRYGLNDIRNYDSVELATALAETEALFESEPGVTARTSRRTVTWEGVARSRMRLARAGVRVVLADTPPPPSRGLTAEPLAGLWMATLEEAALPPAHRTPGEIRIDLSRDLEHRNSFAVTFDPGWIAEIDGERRPIRPTEEGQIFVDRAEGGRELRLAYQPADIRLGTAVTGVSLALLCLLTALRNRTFTREKRFGGLDAPAGAR